MGSNIFSKPIIRRLLRWSVGAAALLFLLALIYKLFVRPWHLRWGATPAEVARRLPGDEFIPLPRLSATHAITIHAPVSEVWPWIAQLGQGRAGFYSYDWLENLFGCDILNAEVVHPEWQDIKPGDGVRLHPKMPPIPVAIVEPGRSLVLHGDSRLDPGARILAGPGNYLNTVWTFYLEPVDAHTTRFIERTRSDWNPTLRNIFLNQIVTEPISFPMERRMLLGIKERAERGR